ncbi:hypothetical protein V490_04793 [Pseudogymnoascus sp. VKM F-3557]|nr:hypothetical protein V490_04793 [Pseudogymnoascus sp. VKM F-3557]
MPLHGHEIKVQRLNACQQKRQPAQHAQYRLGVRHGELSSFGGTVAWAWGKEMGPELRARNFKRRGWFTPAKLNTVFDKKQNRELKLPASSTQRRKDAKILL